MGDLVVTKHRKVHSKPDDTGADEESEDMTLSDEQDVAQTSTVNGSSNEEGSHVQSDTAKPYADGDAREVDIDNMTHKTDSFQELLQLAQEYESVDASKRGLDNGCHSQNEGFNDVSPEEIVEQSTCVKEDVNCVSNQKVDMEMLHSEEAGLKSTASEKEASASFSVSQSKTSPTGDQRNAQNKEVRDTGQAHASVNRRSSRSASFSSITIGPSRSHFTIPQPFSLRTDKRALGGGRPRDDQVLPKPLGFKGDFEDSNSRTPMVSRKPSAKLPVVKSIHSQSINKHLDDPLKRLTIHANSEHYDDDAMSISSVQSCSQAPKAKASRFTSTSSFKFQSDARAQQRKEYYLKLQERLSAKEEEMKHMQAKAKKEKEEEIKLLRKSMTFKASPVPSFYQEGPPPKAELPKTPPTRAKSPNFTRRESHSGFSTRLCSAIRCEAELRSSLSPRKPGKTNDKEVLGKENQSKRSSIGGRSSLSESPNEKPADRKTSSSGSATALELLDVEICVSGGGFEDVHVKVRDPLTVSSDLMMSDEEDKAHVVQSAESMHVTSNGEGDKVYVDKIKCGEDVSAVNGGMLPKESNVLKGHGNANAGVLSSNSNKAKADRKVQQPLAYEERGLV